LLLRWHWVVNNMLHDIVHCCSEKEPAVCLSHVSGTCLRRAQNAFRSLQLPSYSRSHAFPANSQETAADSYPESAESNPHLLCNGALIFCSILSSVWQLSASSTLPGLNCCLYFLLFPCVLYVPPITLSSVLSQ